MSNSFEAEAGHMRSATGVSKLCQPLLEAATPAVFETNAFRITGLPVDATTRQIANHANRLKVMEELGQGEVAHSGAFSLKPPPTIDQIRDAIQRLKDPERRIIDEFFWFWPMRFGGSGSDPAIQALTNGQGEVASRIWAEKETDPVDGVVAMHNLALVHHLAALEWESYSERAELSADQRQGLEQYWRKAFKRWEHLADDDLLWAKVAERVKQIGDPRLTTGFVRRMRATLPEALDKINAQLAVRYAESGKMELARLHVQFMRETNRGMDNVERTAEMILAPVETRLREQLRSAREGGERTPKEGANIARELVESARRSLPLFDLFFGKDSNTRNELGDEIAALCNQLQVIYHKATDDDQTCLEILKIALPFATSIELRQRIEANIGTLSGNLEYKKLEPIFGLLKSIQDSSDHPRRLLKVFRDKVVPALRATFIKGTLMPDLLDAAAIVLRGISLEAWNTHRDKATAVEANNLALAYAQAPDLKARLQEDHVALKCIPGVLKRTAQQIGYGCVVPIGKLGLFGLVVAGIIGGIVESCNPTGSFTRSAESDSSTYSAPSTAGSAGGDRYRVPAYMSAELRRDWEAIENEKARIEAFARRLDTLRAEIDRDRMLLDQGSQFAVNEFNRRVDRYNSMLEQLDVEVNSLNQMVNDYNFKVRRYSRE